MLVKQIIEQELEALVGTHPEFHIEENLTSDWGRINIKWYGALMLSFVTVTGNDIKVEVFTGTDKKLNVSITNADELTNIVRAAISSYPTELLKLHKKHSEYYKELPSKIPVPEKPDINISLLDKDWLETKFQEISDDLMNGETIENIRYFPEQNRITFDIDRGRYTLRDDCGSITINGMGIVRVDLCEALEGCGIDSEFEAVILEKLNLVN